MVGERGGNAEVKSQNIAVLLPMDCLLYHGGRSCPNQIKLGLYMYLPK